MGERTFAESTKRESVWAYPHPPAVEDVPQKIKIVFNGQIIVDSQHAKRVLETGHPPVYYIPMQDIKNEALHSSSRRTWCEWKGEARYFDVILGDLTARNAAWFYPHPVPEFAEIKDLVAFYADKMDACFVGDERVQAQEGGYYGGWITSNIDGPLKGSPGLKG